MKAEASDYPQYTFSGRRNDVLENLGIKTAENGGYSEAVMRRLGTAATVMKWGGRGLTIAAAVKDGYEIYTATRSDGAISTCAVKSLLTSS